MGHYGELGRLQGPSTELNQTDLFGGDVSEFGSVALLNIVPI